MFWFDLDSLLRKWHLWMWRMYLQRRIYRKPLRAMQGKLKDFFTAPWWTLVKIFVLVVYIIFALNWIYRTALQSVKFSTIVLNALDLTRDFTIRAYVIKDVRMLRSFLSYRKHVSIQGFFLNDKSKNQGGQIRSYLNIKIWF